MSEGISTPTSLFAPVSEKKATQQYISRNRALRANVSASGATNVARCDKVRARSILKLGYLRADFTQLSFYSAFLVFCSK